MKQALCDAAWPTLLAALLFIGSLNGGLVADDTRFLVDTPRALVTPRQAFTQTLWNRNPPGWTNQHYRPLALLAFAAIFRLFGADYAVFHAANALLNAGATAALFFFLTGLRFPRRICLAAALLFAVDPLHVEAVAWITGMMETLAGGLVLTSLACFAYGRRFASVLLAALAILTKESSMSLLPMIFAIEWWRCRRESREGAWRSAVWSTAPYLPLAIAYSLARAAVIGRAPEGLWREALWTGLGLSPGVAWPAVAAKYATLLFVPWPLVSSYNALGALESGAVLSLIGLVAVLLWRFRRTADDLLLAAALAAFPLALPILASPLLTGGLEVQDRYAYVATAGACLFAALLLDRLAWPRPGRGLFFACLLLAPLGVLGTELQVPVWQNEMGMWAHNVEVEPDSLRGSVALSRALFAAGRFSEAEGVLRRGLIYHPHSLALNTIHDQVRFLMESKAPAPSVSFFDGPDTTADGHTPSAVKH